MMLGHTKTTEENRVAIEQSQIARPARLQTAYSLWHGELSEITSAGATFTASTPPRIGVTALINWDSIETFCQVVWIEGDRCGVRFEREIAQYAGAQPAPPREKPAAAAAAVGNIPFGRKRSAGTGVIRRMR